MKDNDNSKCSSNNREPLNNNNSTKKVKIATNFREQYKILNNKNTRKNR